MVLQPARSPGQSASALPRSFCPAGACCCQSFVGSRSDVEGREPRGRKQAPCRGVRFLPLPGLSPAAAAPCRVVLSPPWSFPGRAEPEWHRSALGAARTIRRHPWAAALKGKARRGAFRVSAGPRGGLGVGCSPPRVWEALSGWWEEMSQSSEVRTHIGLVGWSPCVCSVKLN